MVWISEKVFGQSFENYQLEQRSKWLGTMGPVFLQAGSFLHEALKELTIAQDMYQKLLEQLAIEGRAAKYR